MKRLLFKLSLASILLMLVSCSGITPPSEIQNDVSTDISQTQSITPKQEDLEEGIETPDNKNTYIVKHEMESTVYEVTIMEDTNRNYALLVCDSESNQLQLIPIESDIFPEIDLLDVNSDGYTDIVANTGGTLNETHEIYVWDASSQNYLKVRFEGFDMLSYFEVYEDYLLNWVKESVGSGFVQKLVWIGNTLKMESEEYYQVDD